MPPIPEKESDATLAVSVAIDRLMDARDGSAAEMLHVSGELLCSQLQLIRFLWKDRDHWANLNLQACELLHRQLALIENLGGERQRGG